MSALSSLDIFGLWMTAALIFSLPLAWLAGQDDSTERAVRGRLEKLGHW